MKLNLELEHQKQFALN
jgi:hypothetical protein